MSASNKVLVCHCMDVEGPMEETVSATWERLVEEDGVHINCEPNKENLILLQNCKLDLGLDESRADYLSRKYSKHNLDYLKSWKEIDAAFSKINSVEFRQKYSSPLGTPYLINWFIYDHFGFKTNPRFHDDGIHHIFDHYKKSWLNNKTVDDGLYWHYHHPPASGDAVEWNTNLFQNGVYEEILARRIIERNWFPSTFRAGGHIERNDLNFWLEMFIPFDFSSRTPLNLDDFDNSGVVCDWRHAPKEWGSYSPSLYDYRKIGDMRRKLFRCLDLKTWITQITEEEVRQAFSQARLSSEPVVLAYYNHDYRDISSDIEFGHDLVSKISKEFGDVQWDYSNCLSAARASLGMDRNDDKDLNIKTVLEGNLLTVKTNFTPFGPQPFLAIQENGKFFRDNFTDEGDNTWCYRFRKLDDLEKYGVAANDKFGNTVVNVSKFQ